MSKRPDGTPNLTPSLNAEVYPEADPEKGIEVVKPHPGGSLALAGVVAGDFIQSIEGRKLPELRDFVAEVHCTLLSVSPAMHSATSVQVMKRVPGDTVSVRIWDSRQRKFRNLSLEVGAKVCDRTTRCRSSCRGGVLCRQGRSIEEVRAIRSKAKPTGLTISVDISGAEPSNQSHKKKSPPSRAGAKKTPAGTPKATASAGTPRSTPSAQRRPSAGIRASASHASLAFAFLALASAFSSPVLRHFFFRCAQSLSGRKQGQRRQIPAHASTACRLRVRYWAAAIRRLPCAAVLHHHRARP